MFSRFRVRRGVVLYIFVLIVPGRGVPDDEPTGLTGYFGPPQLSMPEGGASSPERSATPLSPRTHPNVRVNDRINDDFTPQSETTMAIDPTNALRLVGGFNDCRGFFDPTRGGISGWGFSIDGARTWTGVPTGLPKNDLGDFGSLGDPSLDVDAAGNFYFSSVYSVNSSAGGTINVAVNRGHFEGAQFVWRPATLATDFVSGAGADKDHVGVDKINGYVYVTYANFTVPPFNGQIEVVRSTDGGQTWSAPVVVAAASSTSHNGSIPRVGPDGELYVAWENGVSQTSRSIHIRKALQWPDFGPDVTVATITTPRTPPFGFRSNEFPTLAIDTTDGSRRGHVYVAWNDGRFGGAFLIGTILLTHSADGGEGSWSAPVRLDDDGTPVSRDRWFPWVSVNPQGAVLGSWYDRRLSTDEHPELTDTFGARFTPEEGTGPNFRITDQSFPMGNFGMCIPYFGDYNGAVATRTLFYALWGDAREGDPDTYSGARQIDPLFVDSEKLEICGGHTVETTVTAVGGLDGFQGDVDLSFVAPVDTLSASFDPNPIPSPSEDGSESRMTIFADASAAPDTYPVAAVGSGGARSVVASISLVVRSLPPAPAEPQEPWDGQTIVLELPTFIWSGADRASTYRLEVFSGAECSGTPVRRFDAREETHFTVPADQVLSVGSTYSWRVVAQNACGDGTSMCQRFTTRRCGPAIDLIANGGFEDGFNGWTLNETGTQPVLTTDQAHSGMYSARLGVTGPSGTPDLWQTVYIPLDASHANLVFWFLPAGLRACSLNNCEERQAFVVRPNQPDRPVFLMRDISLPGDWTSREFSLAAFAGEWIEVHFRTTSRTNPARSGMYLDDVSVTYDLCEPCI